MAALTLPDQTSVAPSANPRWPRLTRSGAATLVIGIILLILGTFTGILEAVVAGLLALCVLALSTVVVLWGSPELTVSREVGAQRIACGATTTVRLVIAQRGGRPRLPGTLVDHLDGAPLQGMNVAPRGTRRQGGGQPLHSADYGLRAERRGLTRIGPLHVRTEDPFGLVHAESQAAGPVDIVVLPERISVGTPADAGEVGPDSVADRRRASEVRAGRRGSK